MLCSSSTALEAQWQTILEYKREMLKVTDNRTHISEKCFNQMLNVVQFVLCDFLCQI